MFMKNLKNKCRRGLAVILSLVMCLGMLTVPAFAAEELQHTEGCGYVCAHQHDKDCGAVTFEDSTDPADGYIAAVEEQEAILCPNGEDCTGEEDGHVPPVEAVEAKDEVMGKKQVIDETACTHDCEADDNCVWVCAEDCPVKAAGDAAKAEAEEAAKREAAKTTLADMIDALPAPEEIDPEDEEQVEAVYEQIAKIYAFAEENGLGNREDGLTDQEAAATVKAVVEALHPKAFIPEGDDEDAELFTVNGTPQNKKEFPEKFTGETLADAFSCLSEGTITLNADVTSTKPIVFTRGQKITLDLKGHTLSFDSTVTSNSCIEVIENVTFTIIGNGEISFADSPAASGIVMYGGTLAINPDAEDETTVKLTGSDGNKVANITSKGGQVPMLNCKNAVFDGNVELYFSNSGGIQWIVDGCRFTGNVEAKTPNNKNFLAQEGVKNCTFEKTPYYGVEFFDYENRVWKKREIKLSQSNIAENVGETVTLELTRTVEPESMERAVNWSSSNELIATVNENGVVTIHRLGIAVITATLPAPEDGFGNFKELTVQCSVTGILADWFNCTECSEDAPHLIETKEDLDRIRTHLNDEGRTTGYFKLANDIVFTEADFATDGLFYNDGRGFEPIGVHNKPIGEKGTLSHTFFHASFDGDGHTISGLKIVNDGSYGDFTGLFGLVQGGSIIKNLTLKDCNVTCEASSSSQVGMLVGYLHGQLGGELAALGCSEVKNCSIAGGTVKSLANSQGTGGLAGRLCTGPSVTNCTVTDVTIEGRSYAGGIAGVAAGANVDGCIVDNVKVSGGYVGGVIGSSSSASFNIKNTVARTALRANPDAATGDIRIGGAAGNPYVNVGVSNCIILSDVESDGMPSGKALYAGGIYSNTFNHGWSTDQKQWLAITDTYCSFHVADELKEAEGNMIGQLIGRIDRNYPVVTDKMPYHGDSMAVFGGEVSTNSRPSDFPIPSPALLAAESEDFTLSFEPVSEDAIDGAILPEEYWSTLGTVPARPTEAGSYKIIVTYTQGEGENLETRTYALPWYVTVEEAPIPEHEHSYTRTVITAPTCTAQGYTTHTCACGDSYVDGYVSATGHAWDAGEVTAPTCTTEGYTTYTCTVCGEKHVGEDSAVPATGHAWNNGEITLRPTYTREGERTYTCTVCGATRTESIDRLPYEPSYPSGGGNSSSGGSTGGTTTNPSTPTTTIPDDPTPLDPGVTIGDQDVPLTGITFEDVTPGDWFYEAVQYVYGKDLMKGTSETQFSPYASTQRGMIVTILHRLEGTPAAEASAFADVEAGQWYANAVGWGSANGVVEGYSATEFRPLQNITREQLAAILYRYAQLKGYDTSKRADLSGYSDASAISAYALEAMRWAVAEGLIAGKTETTLAPGGEATRAEAAMILMRFCETIAAAPAANETQGLPDGI